MQKDFYHEVVVQALTVDGWQVSPKQYRLILPERWLYIDILAIHPIDGTQILVEFKGFEKMPSPVDYLESAVGQYEVYRSILSSQNSSIPLYMAVPQSAFDGIFKESIGKIVLAEIRIQLIVFDPNTQEIVEWIR